MATFELYRRSTIGMCLTETLDEMVSNGVLSPELAIQVLVQFDKSMTEALDSQVKSKVTIKGHLHTYRFCDNVWTFIVQDAIFKYDEMQEHVGQVKIVACDSKLLTQLDYKNVMMLLRAMNLVALVSSTILTGFSDIERLSFLLHRLKAAMSSLKSGKVKVFELLDGMVLQVDVSGLFSGHCAKVKLQLQNTSQTWILHWGCISIGNKKWFVPSFYPSGTIVHKKSALRTPFVKEGDAYVVVIELRDPKIHAIEFVLKDTRHNKWLKMNGASFRINLQEEIDVEQYGAGNGKCLLNEMSHEEVEKPLTHRYPCTSVLFPKLSTSSSAWQGLSQKNNTFSNIYAMSLEDTYNKMVGEKSCSIRFLSKKVPTWIRFPASVVLPYGVFEKVLSEDINKDMVKKIACLCELVDKGDISKFKTIQETVLQLKAPRRMGIEVRKKMKSSRIPWPRGPGEDTWSRVWQAIKQIWASNWNERAYISCRRTHMNHDKLCIGILIQEQIRADYAFVTYTNHPVSRDSSEIYTEIVNGSVETLVGASPGRAMSSITKKSDLKSPIVTCYPSKSTGLYTKNKMSIILRPYFLSENTNGYKCDGTYDSWSMENKEEIVLDYSRDPLVIDLSFQALIHSKIAEAAKIIEDLYGCAQNIEGVVQDGEVYLLQCKPLIL